MKQRRAFTKVVLTFVVLTVLVQASTAYSTTKQHGADNQQDTSAILLSSWSNSAGSYHIFSTVSFASAQDWHSVAEKTDAPVAWSHDLKHIAFLRSDGLYTTNADGTQQTKHYTNGKALHLTDFAWSYDDSQIFVSLQELRDNMVLKTKIIAVNVSNNRQKKIISGSFEAYYPTADPNGKSVAFAITAASGKQKRTFAPGIYLYDFAKNRVRKLKQVPSSEPIVDVSLAWSPTQNKIAFAETNTNPGSNRYSDLFTIDVATKKVQQITKTDQFESDPTWSPDGTALAFIVRDKDSIGNKMNLLTIGSNAQEAQKQATILTSSEDIGDIFWRG